MVVAVKALACELPSRLGVPLARLHVPDIAAEVVSRGIAAEISGTTIWRWLSEDAIKPWRVRSWIFPRDPDFEAKVGRVLELYAREWEGEPLADGDYVVSADEKTSIQARIRRHPSLPAAPGHPSRTEFEYTRGGAVQYLAAWDVHRAKVFGRCEPATGIEPFDRLLSQVMTTRALRLGAAGLPARRQRQQPPRPGFHRPGPGQMAHSAPGAPARPRVLDQPGGDLLLGHPGQSAHPQRLRQPGRGRAAASCVRAPLRAGRRPLSNGSSPAMPSPCS